MMLFNSSYEDIFTLIIIDLKYLFFFSQK